MDYKNFSGSVKAEKSGEFSALFCKFDQVDKDGDLILREAFTPGQKVACCWGHDWSRICGSGRVEILTGYPGPGAVFEGKFFMDTQAGEEAYRTVKNLGELSQWSWGFRTIDSAYEERNGETIRVIKRVELFEVSPVLIGAGYDTQLLAIKGGDTQENRRLYNEFRRINSQLESALEPEPSEMIKEYNRFLRLSDRIDGRK